MIGSRLTTDDVVPDIIEPLVGIRGWNMGDGRLYSPWQDPHRPWEVTEQAICTRSQPDPEKPHRRLLNKHSAPDNHCICGLYAFHTQSMLEFHTSLPVAGIVQGWGVCEVHDDGFRSEHMRICALSHTPFAILIQSPLARGFKHSALVTGVLCSWAPLVAWSGAKIFDMPFGNVIGYFGMSIGATLLLSLLVLLGITIRERVRYHRAEQELHRCSEYYGVPIMPYHQLGFETAPFGRRAPNL